MFSRRNSIRFSVTHSMVSDELEEDSDKEKGSGHNQGWYRVVVGRRATGRGGLICRVGPVNGSFLHIRQGTQDLVVFHPVPVDEYVFLST